MVWEGPMLKEKFVTWEWRMMKEEVMVWEGLMLEAEVVTGVVDAQGKGSWHNA